MARTVARLRCGGSCRGEGELDASATRREDLSTNRMEGGREGEGTEQKRLFGSEANAKQSPKNGILDPHFAHRCGLVLAAPHHNKKLP